MAGVLRRVPLLDALILAVVEHPNRRFRDVFSADLCVLPDAGPHTGRGNGIHGAPEDPTPGVLLRLPRVCRSVRPQVYHTTLHSHAATAEGRHTSLPPALHRGDVAPIRDQQRPARRGASWTLPDGQNREGRGDAGDASATVLYRARLGSRRELHVDKLTRVKGSLSGQVAWLVVRLKLCVSVFFLIFFFRRRSGGTVWKVEEGAPRWT